MRAEEQLQWMADTYPSLYPTRKHALNQLFCVVGNGYEWADGEIVRIDSQRASQRPLGDVERAKFPYGDLAKVEHKDHFEILHELREENTESRQKELLGLLMCCNFEWYPISRDFSLLCSIPEDVKPDWRELAEECKRELEKDGVDWLNPEP